MDHKKELLFIRFANIKLNIDSMRTSLAPLLKTISKDSCFEDFSINNTPVSFTSFRNLQKNIRFCLRTLFFLYSPQANLPYHFPKPDYAALKLRHMKVMNLINSKIKYCSPILHRKVLSESQGKSMASVFSHESIEPKEYRIQPHYNYPDISPIHFDSCIYMSLAQFLEKRCSWVIVRCAYKKCTNYFISKSIKEIACREKPFGDNCLNLLKKQTSTENLGSKIRK